MTFAAVRVVRPYKMPGVIDRQLDSLHASASESRRIAPGIDVATAAGDFEDLLALAVGLYDALGRAVRRWRSTVADWEGAGWVEQARQFESRYRGLKATFDRVAQLLTEWEGGGLAPEGADRFRHVKKDLDLLCELSVDRMLKVDESLREGRGRTMAEVRDELRRRMGA